MRLHMCDRSFTSMVHDQEKLGTRFSFLLCSQHGLDSWRPHAHAHAHTSWLIRR